jgi:hypothetical protein
LGKTKTPTKIVPLLKKKKKKKRKIRRNPLVIESVSTPRFPVIGCLPFGQMFWSSGEPPNTSQKSFGESHRQKIPPINTNWFHEKSTNSPKVIKKIVMLMSVLKITQSVASNHIQKNNSHPPLDFILVSTRFRSSCETSARKKVRKGKIVS